MIPYDALFNIRSPSSEFAWSERDVILYALAIGYGRDPLDPGELPFIFERELRVVPTFATVSAWGSNPPIRDAGVDYSRVVHAAQEVELHRPLPAAARVRAVGGITAALDKGDKGALIDAEVVLRDVGTDEPYATNRVTWFARADGHFGGPTGDSAVPHPMPERAPDQRVEIATRADQAVLYRLLGDRNPLHIDSDTARRAGFDRPILHGLCTFGITCRAVLTACCDGDPARLASHAVRFSAPVYPGDMIAVDLWRDDPVVSFEARVAARGATVIRNGRARLR